MKKSEIILEELREQIGAEIDALMDSGEDSMEAHYIARDNILALIEPTLSQRDYDNLVRDAMKWRARGELEAIAEGRPDATAVAKRLYNCLRNLTDGIGDGYRPHIDAGRQAVIDNSWLDNPAALAPKAPPFPEAGGLREAVWNALERFRRNQISLGVESLEMTAETFAEDIAIALHDAPTASAPGPGTKEKSPEPWQSYDCTVCDARDIPWQMINTDRMHRVLRRNEHTNCGPVVLHVVVEG